MKYKTIITDLDRTLLRTDKSISERTLAVMGRCKEEGILLVAATARPFRSVVEYNNLIGFDALVCLNGAYIAYKDKIIERCIDKSEGEEFLSKLCSESSPVISVECGGVLYANTVFEEWESVYWDKFPALPEGPIHKILITYSENEEMLVKRYLPKSLYYTVANGQLLQIMSKDAAKMKGISTLLETVGISVSDSVYFGDDNDDIEPILQCGLGIAVANGIDRVKACADIVTESNDYDGVAIILEKLLLGDIK
ncbi:MAG: HAD hydrolase family protein [Clostridia bacterium]|nr:HAD hydrolase family protein [Clostridia bacterium]